MILAMAIHLALHHQTIYRYDRPVVLGPQLVRLRPAPHCRTPILSFSLRVSPEEHFIHWQQDPYANYLARLVFPKPSDALRIEVDLVAEMAVYNPFDFFLAPEAERFPFDYAQDLARHLSVYRSKGPRTPRLEALLNGYAGKSTATMDYLVGINQDLQRQIAYTVRMEPGVQTPEQTLELASGSCRDTGWLLVQVLRHLGLAARFVSGYLIQLKPDVPPLEGPPSLAHDFSDLHAWCEVYLPGAGWIGLDPTSGLLAGEGHIPVACTPEPEDAAPVDGAHEPCEVQFAHQMSVQRIHESARVTKPYTEAQWSAIEALGKQVDCSLLQHDVRLTMGGEPTFVASADRDAPEWNTEALGPSKRSYASELLMRLQARYGAGGFLHFGQGKWYPGEQLPRWALAAYWRRDQQPCWRNPRLQADESLQGSFAREDGQRFIMALARRLGLGSDMVQAAFEDTLYYLWRERRLPVNVDPFDARLDNELERARLRRVFQQGLAQPTGFVLPIRRSDSTALAGSRWESGPWILRDGRLYLIPGDSPMGYRLPLDSLLWVPQSERPLGLERDPFAPESGVPLPEAEVLRGLPESGATRQQDPDFDAVSGRSPSAAGSPPPRMQIPDALHPTVAGDPRSPEDADAAGKLTRTALCVEVRNPGRASGPKVEEQREGDGTVYVFMPPLERVEDYLELLAAVEDTAEELAIPVVIEGYPPPRDARLVMLQVTPDPGVLEVNIHPSASWEELVERTEFLYAAANDTRLSAEKFMLDGRHTGTGGGNHIVLGGASPPDSPFLRRPHLLGSLLTFWHNHPSLSYLFSGLFIGPTSQSPRIDEARNDQVYEVEIALAELERQLSLREACPPWLIDRSLRNLLIDVSGNTHRAEFCIDKLYAPEGPSGRLGLLEMRAFEMPPHPRMSLSQQLLIRAVLAWFWREPYTGHRSTRLSRWGTALHDRFLLPTFVRLDFEDVLEELAQAGFVFDPSWFEPHFEFRFPAIGQVETRGIAIRLRHALEPWHVMGEESAAGATVRYVDSSLERLELKVSGCDTNRFAITVNGVVAPLQPTGVAGEAVVGVRYRAWQPASALHPSIAGHAPLQFDLVDKVLARSLGGCRYHVAHPGGRNYQSFPVNAFEAESRRLARFCPLEHTPGTMRIAAAVASEDFPFTLDLRRSVLHNHVPASAATSS